MSKYQVGDRVEVKITGDVTDVIEDLLGHRLPFLTVTEGVSIWTGTPGIQIRKVPLRKPQVGDWISGKQLCATPWRHGAVIEYAIEDEDESDSWRALLLDDGTWIEDSGERMTFRDLREMDSIRVVYLP